MQEQSLQQVITINYATDGLAPTGANTWLFVAIALILIATALIIGHSRLISRKPYTRSFGVFIFLAIAAAGLVASGPLTSAAPTLSIGTGQQNLTLSIPKGGGTATAATTITSATVNPTGYELTAALAEMEPGVDISLSGGDVSTDTPLNAGDAPLSLLSTTEANQTDDTTNVTLTFSIDGTVEPGAKQLKLTYKAIDNALPATMQNFTTEECDDLPIFTGTNEEAVLTLHDPRGEGQDYQVAKLADGNCWMLNDLKLGSATGSTELTPADTNIAGNFTLPQLYSGDSSDYVSHDDPYAYGPLPGDTGSGATKYGYLYNWPAATAGETQATMPGDGTNDDIAPYSICPAGWRLPTGGPGSELVGLDIAFGGTGSYQTSGPSIAQWQHDGAFKGVFSGSWWEGFVVQGDWGNLWSASAFPGFSGYALGANFGAGYVGPVNGGGGRDTGLAVRCLLQ